jgi:hypothetical protein
LSISKYISDRSDSNAKYREKATKYALDNPYPSEELAEYKSTNPDAPIHKLYDENGRTDTRNRQLSLDSILDNKDLYYKAKKGASGLYRLTVADRREASDAGAELRESYPKFLAGFNAWNIREKRNKTLDDMFVFGGGYDVFDFQNYYDEWSGISTHGSPAVLQSAVRELRNELGTEAEDKGKIEGAKIANDAKEAEEKEKEDQAKFSAGESDAVNAIGNSNMESDSGDSYQGKESSQINDLDSASKEDTGTSAINPDSTEKSESVDDSMISASDILMEPEVSPSLETSIESVGSDGGVINNSESTSNEAIYSTDIINSSSPGEILTDASPNQAGGPAASINNLSNQNTEVSSQDVTSNSINEVSSQDTKISNEYNSTQSSENSLGDSTLNMSDDMSSNKVEVANETSNVSEAINSNSLNNVLDSSSASNDQTTSETSLTEVSKNDVNVNKEVFPMNIDNTKTNTSSSNTTSDSNKNTPESASSVSENNTNNNTSVNNKTEESGKKDETPMGVNVDMGEVVSRLGRIEYLLNSTLDVRIKS